LDSFRDRGRRKELRAQGRTVVASCARCSNTRDRADNSGGIHLADAVIAEVGDEDVAGGVRRQPVGVSRKLGAGGQPAIAGKARRAGAGEAV
jgi:hypothetical protein